MGLPNRCVAGFEWRCSTNVAGIKFGHSLFGLLPKLEIKDTISALE